MAKKRKGNKREKILLAAEEVFANKGFYMSRVSDIAKRAKVAEGTIYIYFESKEDIILSIFKEKMGKWLESLKEKLSQINDPIEKLREIIGTHFSTLYENPHLAQLIQIELRACSAFMRGGSAPEMKAYLNLIEEVIEEGKEKGVFRKDFSTKVAARALLGIMDEMATIWVLKKKFDLRELTEEVFDIFYKGIKGGAK